MLIIGKQKSYENLICCISGLQRQKGASPDSFLFSQDSCLIFFTLFNVFFSDGRRKEPLYDIYGFTWSLGINTYPSIISIG